MLHPIGFNMKAATATRPSAACMSAVPVQAAPSCAFPEPRVAAGARASAGHPGPFAVNDPSCPSSLRKAPRSAMQLALPARPGTRKTRRFKTPNRIARPLPSNARMSKDGDQSARFCRLLMRSSTTAGSASVDVSPKFEKSSSAILRRMRRIILPERVLGRPGAN